MTSRLFPALNSNLVSISEFVLEEAKKLPFSSKELYAIELSVVEACENIIDHSYHGENLGEIEIIAVAHEDHITFTLKDHGTPFDPENVPEPDLCSPLDTRCERGLGIYTMRKLMDVVEYDFSEPGVNILTLVKYKR